MKSHTVTFSLLYKVMITVTQDFLLYFVNLQHLTVLIFHVPPFLQVQTIFIFFSFVLLIFHLPLEGGGTEVFCWLRVRSHCKNAVVSTRLQWQISVSSSIIFPSLSFFLTEDTFHIHNLQCDMGRGTQDH